MALAPLNVLVVNVGGEPEETYEVNIGLYGRKYDLSFIGLINLIRNRCGYEQKRLEYKPR
jgi:hypothetical protein